MPESRRRWTIMVFMAGDNGKLFDSPGGKRLLLTPMERAGRGDLAEMESVGSNDDVAVLAQFDTLSGDGGCSRIFVRPGGAESQVEPIAEQNTGDPCSLRDFIVWGVRRCPADRYAVVLWNHGAGWKDDDIYAFARRGSVDVKAGQSELRSSGEGGRLAAALFLTSALRVVGLESADDRAICYDDSSMDFLDNVELQRAFREAQAQTGRTIDLIGMDACLMSMVEVVYQLRDHAQCVVASQEVEPLAGWPYAEILRGLARDPAIGPGELAQLIVRAYVRSLDDGTRGGGMRVTQSAIRVAGIEPLARAIGEVAAALTRLRADDDLYARRAFDRASQRALRFADADYVDLYDFLSILRDEYDGRDAGLQGGLERALGLLDAQGAQALIAANAVAGDRLERARGLSIYLPQGGCSQFYATLDFAAHGWGELISLKS